MLSVKKSVLSGLVTVGLTAVVLALWMSPANSGPSRTLRNTGHTVATSSVAASSLAGAYSATPTPIQHVVVIYQENHSFDNVLGVLCQSRPTPCDGTSVYRDAAIGSGTLGVAHDIVPQVDHTTNTLQKALADQWSTITECSARIKPAYRCLTQYQPGQIPNVSTLASSFAVSDRTFALSPVPSFGAHLDITAATLDGFSGNNPKGGSGWGCDSGLEAQWSPPGSRRLFRVPSCVPAQSGTAAAAAEPTAVQSSPVASVPSIMDRLVAANKTWKLYGAAAGTYGYIWSVCTYYAACLYDSSRSANSVPMGQVLTDAAQGTLPNWSIMTPASGPSGPTSQHNGESMAVGDNWIGQVVSAIENGPDWHSTAILLTWDDCGCFYDHVQPPTGEGFRAPMLLISPYAKAGYTDSTPASFASILAFSEHVLGLAPLNANDASAYDYMGSFAFGQTPIPPVKMTNTPISRQTQSYLVTHPPNRSDPS